MSGESYVTSRKSSFAGCAAVMEQARGSLGPSRGCAREALILSVKVYLESLCISFGRAICMHE